MTLALLAMSPRSHAEFLVEAGAAPTLQLEPRVRQRWGAGVALGFALPVTDSLLAGIVLQRAHYRGLAVAHTSVLARLTQRWRDGRWGLALAGELGMGWFTGPLWPDVEDDLGVSGGARIAVELELTRELRLELAFEQRLQLGNRLSVLPTLLGGIVLF